MRVILQAGPATMSRQLNTFRIVMIGLLASLYAIAPAFVAKAQQDDAGLAGSGISYLMPFPEGDTYRLQVYGDEFAEGLLVGLLDAFPNERGMQIARKHRVIAALIKPEHEEELKSEELSREPVHIAVVMLGYNDRGSIRISPNVRPLQITSEEWQAEYGRRVDRLLKVLKKRGAAIYLVGQPIMRNSTVNRDAEIINEVMRERALQNGVRFIDIAEGFADDGGGFSQFGPDISGGRQKLREGDGISFTNVGNRKLAHFVETDLRRDLNKARAERAIPLAGADTEQARINSGKTTGPQAIAAVKAAPVAARGAQSKQLTAGNSMPDTGSDLKADNSRITIRASVAANREDNIAVDIVRPALAAAVVALVTRREVAERAPQVADGIVEEIGDGLTVMSTISAPADLAGGGSSGRKLAPNTVLVRGERLTSKPGRADDFSWPRKDLAPIVPIAAPFSSQQPQRPGAPSAKPAVKGVAPRG